MGRILTYQRSKINFYSFLWHAVFLALTTNFMDIDTIMPAMLLNAGGKSWHLGLMTAILLGASNFFQLIFAGYLSGKVYKKSYLILAISIRVLTLYGLAILFLKSDQVQGAVVIMIIFMLISVFAMSGAFAAVSYIDILGKSIQSDRRQRFFILKESITGVGIFVSALIVRYLLGRLGYPINYAVLFVIAASLLLIASIGFWNIRELRSKSRSLKISHLLKSIPGAVRQDKNLRWYLIVLNTLGMVLTFMPFLILYAKEQFSLSDEGVGNFLVFRVSGMVLSGFLFYRITKRIHYRGVILIAAGLGVLIPWLAFLLGEHEALYQFIFILSGLFVAAYKVLKDGILVEISTNDNRAVYAGISGAGNILTIIFPLLAGYLVSTLGFVVVFSFVSISAMVSLFSIGKLNCRNF